MSPKNPRLIAGLTALGLVGFAATRAATPGDAPIPAPPAAASAPLQVLLKSNGQILHGTVTEEADDYVVRQFGNEIRVPKHDAERAFATLGDVYRYKRSEIPDGDPDEHLKLARWCLSQKLTAEAKLEVQAVLVHSPEAREAKAMLASLEATEARLASRPRVDPGLVQTGGEMVQKGRNAVPGAPMEIDPSILERARHELGLKGIPVIFDLPPAIAAKRADQFTKLVHPLLQAACARCHNESYPGNFQLIQVRSRKELSSNVLRANLDATLRLIDPDNPSKSDLLSSALLPHGNAPTKRPIMSGSNDPRFQVLAGWVNSLRPAGAGKAGAGEAFVQGSAGSGSAFAVDRGQGPGVSPPSDFTNPVKPFELNAKADVMTPRRYVPGRGMVLENEPPSPDEFPVPFSVGGAKPKLDTGTQPASAAIPMPGKAPSASASGSPQVPVGPRGIPANDPTLAPPLTAKGKKAVKIDPEALERALIRK